MNRHDPQIWYDAHHHGPGPLAWVFLALFLVALVGLAVVGARWLLAGRPASSAPAADPADTGLAEALHVARMRYARGEATREEYLQVVEDLSGPGAPARPQHEPPSSPPVAPVG